MKILMVLGVLSLTIGISLVVRASEAWMYILGMGLIGGSYGLAWREKGD